MEFVESVVSPCTEVPNVTAFASFWIILKRGIVAITSARLKHLHWRNRCLRGGFLRAAHTIARCADLLDEGVVKLRRTERFKYDGLTPDHFRRSQLLSYCQQFSWRGRCPYSLMSVAQICCFAVSCR